MCTKIIDQWEFKILHLKIKNATKIVDKPRHETLDILYNERRINSQSMLLDLGGGNHACLGLVLSFTCYFIFKYSLFLCVWECFL